jgi:predicted O-methyltransferase YrrM
VAAPDSTSHPNRNPVDAKMTTATGDLQNIGMRYKTDKAWRHHYLDVYEQQLSSRRLEIKSILEVGVLGGASLRTWKEYFSNSSVVGLDRNSSSLKSIEERIDIRIGDATDPKTAAQFSDGQFDLIIDDGSHEPTQQILTLCYFWSKLSEGGMYFIEDVGYTHKNWKQCIGYFDVFRPKAFFTNKTPWSVLLMLDKKETQFRQEGI